MTYKYNKIFCTRSVKNNQTWKKNRLKLPVQLSNILPNDYRKTCTTPVKTPIVITKEMVVSAKLESRQRVKRHENAETYGGGGEKAPLSKMGIKVIYYNFARRTKKKKKTHWPRTGSPG